MFFNLIFLSSFNCFRRKPLEMYFFTIVGLDLKENIFLPDLSPKKHTHKLEAKTEGTSDLDDSYDAVDANHMEDESSAGDNDLDGTETVIKQELSSFLTFFYIN